MTKKGRYALFCEDEFLFSVDDETYIEFSLFTGKELDETQLMALRARTDYQKAKSKAFEFLAARSHSKKELTDKLSSRYDRFTAGAVTDEIEAKGYLDDASYAGDCVEYVIKTRQMSEKAAFHYLSEKGIDRETAKQALEGYGSGDRARAKELIERNYKEKTQTPEGRRRVFASLARRGFNTSDIKSVLEENADPEWDE